MAWRVHDLEVEAGDRHGLAVGDLHDTLGLAPGDPLAELLLEHPRQLRAERRTTERVDEPVAVVTVDVGRELTAADRRHGEDMVDVPVGEEHGRGLQPVLREHLAQRLLDPDPGVDDEALLTGSIRQDIAVGPERLRRERDGQHGPTLRAPPLLPREWVTSSL